MDGTFDRLAGKGLRITRQRKVILEVLQGTQTHPDARWIYEQVRRRIPRVSLGTIYRTLDVLKKAGLIRELTGTGAFARYEAKLDRHHHLICSRCGRVVDAYLSPSIDLAKRLKAQEEFEVLEFRVEFYGLCSKCRR